MPALQTKKGELAGSPFSGHCQLVKAKSSAVKTFPESFQDSEKRSITFRSLAAIRTTLPTPRRIGRRTLSVSIVLAEPFHLSYPYVFEWQGSHYMIPESGAAKSVRLYRASELV